MKLAHSKVGVLALALGFVCCSFATCEQPVRAESEASSMASSESGFGGLATRRANRRARRQLRKQERRTAQEQKKLSKPVKEGSVWNAKNSGGGNGTKRRKRKNKKNIQPQPQAQQQQ